MFNIFVNSIPHVHLFALGTAIVLDRAEHDRGDGAHVFHGLGSETVRVALASPVDVLVHQGKLGGHRRHVRPHTLLGVPLAADDRKGLLVREPDPARGSVSRLGRLGLGHPHGGGVVLPVPQAAVVLDRAEGHAANLAQTVHRSGLARVAPRVGPRRHGIIVVDPHHHELGPDGREPLVRPLLGADGVLVVSLPDEKVESLAPRGGMDALPHRLPVLVIIKTIILVKEHGDQRRKRHARDKRQKVDRHGHVHYFFKKNKIIEFYSELL